MECAEKCPNFQEVDDFVLPLGATITGWYALYEAAAALFIANLYAVRSSAAGFELTMTTQVIIAVTATMAAIELPVFPRRGW